MNPLPAASGGVPHETLRVSQGKFFRRLSSQPPQGAGYSHCRNKIYEEKNKNIKYLRKPEKGQL